MAGLIPIKPREGNRLEVLAQYILSAFGTAVPVLRPEDVGVDFYCSLGKEEPAGITVSNSFAVQLKSGENPCLELGGKTTGGVWRDYSIKWFLNLEFPLLFGVPYPKEKRLDLYSTSLAQFITTRPKLPFKVRLWPGEPGKSDTHIHPPSEGKDADVTPLDGTCDGKIYDYNLGPPILSCSLADLDHPALVQGFQSRLTELLKSERRNAIYRALGLPYWTWVLETDTNRSHHLAYGYNQDLATRDRSTILEEIIPFICALGFSYLASNDTEKLEQLKGIARQLPQDQVPAALKGQLAALFA